MSKKPSYEELERKVQELEQEALMRKRVDDVLKRSEERYRMIFNYSPLGIIHFDSNGVILDCNEYFLDIMGAPRERLTGFNLIESLRDERMRSAVIAGISGKPNYFEGDYLSVTGNKSAPIRAMFSRVNSEDGKFLGAVGLFQDITGQRRVEETLRESREFLGRILNSISDPIFVKDRQHRLVLVNDAECLLAGRKREEIIGRTDYDFFPKEQVDIFWEKDEVVFETGEENENEEQITDGMGLTRTISTKKTLYADGAGNKYIVGVIRDITDRKTAEVALQAAHEELKDIIEFLPDATFVIDREKRVIFWNRAMEEMTGVTKLDILGQGDYAYAVPFYGERRPMLIDLLWRDEPEIEKRYDFVKRVGDTIYGEAFVPGACQGKSAHLWSTAAKLLDRDGSIIGYIQSIRDISDRKQAEEAVRQSEEKYRQLFETVSDAILLFDGETRHFTEVNERASQMYGYSRDEFLKLKYTDITAEADLTDSSIRETLAGMRTRVPLRYHRKRDGTVFPAEISSSTLVLAGRRMLCGVIRDITERKQAEDALRESERKYRELVQNANSIILRLDTEGKVTFFNEFAETFFGYSAQEILGRNAVGTIVPETDSSGRDLTQMIRDLALHPERYGSNQNENMLRSGERVWIAWTNKAIADESGDIREVLCVGNDITKRIRAEERLRESEERFRELAENIREVFWVSTPERLLYVSPAYEDIFGKSRESLYEDPKSFMELIHPEDKEHTLQAFIASSERTAPVNEECRIIRPDGSIRWLWARSFPILEQGRLVRTVGSAEDITGLKEAEEFLRIERDLAIGLGSTGSLVEAMRLLLETGLKIGALDSGGVYLVESETGSLRLVCHQGLSDRFVEKVSFYELGSPLARFVMQGEPGYWSRPGRIFETGDLFKREGLLALAAIPVRSEGEVVALLNLASHVQSEIPGTIRSALETLAAQIGGVVSRVRLGEKLKAQSERLQEANTALGVLLRHREQDRLELEDSLLANVKHLVLPYLEKLKRSRMGDEQKLHFEILESHLKEVTSPFVRILSSHFIGLTATEIRVSELIRKGKTSKEIAELLTTSEGAVLFHRQNIRRKLGLNRKKINLQSYLATLIK